MLPDGLPEMCAIAKYPPTEGIPKSGVPSGAFRAAVQVQGLSSGNERRNAPLILNFNPQP